MKYKRKQTKAGFVTARVDQEDLDILKKHDINVSELIRHAIKSAAKKI